jgi:hypothetical protein
MELACIPLVPFCLTLMVGLSESALAGTFEGLPEAVSEDTKKHAVVFDFDGDSCYPAPAVSNTGEMNGGLDNTGSVTGECRELDQFKQANTYCRKATVKNDGATFTVYMYALYFEKDQAVGGLDPGGHRHDWEYVLVWTKDSEVTHASFSEHGELRTKPKKDLLFEGGSVKAVYHKVEPAQTHAMRHADEKNDPHPENELGKWVTPILVEWEQMKSDSVDNKRLRELFNEKFDFGKANCSFSDKHFGNEIAKSPPEGYPSANEWKQAVKGN